jgi:hypothetical protein
MLNENGQLVLQTSKYKVLSSSCIQDVELSKTVKRTFGTILFLEPSEILQNLIGQEVKGFYDSNQECFVIAENLG